MRDNFLTQLQEAVINFKFGKKAYTYDDVDDSKAIEVMTKMLQLHNPSGQRSLDTAITEWIKLAGWGGTQEVFIKNSLYSAIMAGNTLDDPATCVDVTLAITEEINKIVNYKTKKKLTQFEATLSDTSFTGFIDILSRQLRLKHVTNKKTIHYIINNIKGTENTVAYGPGEVFLTLFSNCTKHESAKSDHGGDLQLPNGEVIELKVNKGRMGKSEATDVVKQAITAARKTSKQDTFGVTQKTKLVNKLMDGIKGLTSIMGWDEAVNTFLTPRNAKTKMAKFVMFIDGLNNTAPSVDSTVDIVTDFYKSPEWKHLTLGTLRKFGSKFFPESIGVEEHINKIYSGIENIHTLNRLKSGRKNASLTTSLRDYISVLGADDTDDSKASLSDYLSTFLHNSNDKDRNKIKTRIMDHIQNSSGDLNTMAVQIIAGLQILKYQQDANFHYMLFCNYNTLKKLVIEFTSNIEQNFDRILQATKNFHVDPTIDSRGGFSVTLKI